MCCPHVSLPDNLTVARSSHTVESKSSHWSIASRHCAMTNRKNKAVPDPRRYATTSTPRKPKADEPAAAPAPNLAAPVVNNEHHHHHQHRTSCVLRNAQACRDRGCTHKPSCHL